LTSRLLTSLKQTIKNFALIPAGGGCFELTVDGELIHSKLQTGSFPDEQWALDAVRSRLAKS
jgi:selenoprotein W-related protein